MASAAIGAGARSNGERRRWLGAWLTRLWARVAPEGNDLRFALDPEHIVAYARWQDDRRDDTE